MFGVGCWGAVATGRVELVRGAVKVLRVPESLLVVEKLWKVCKTFLDFKVGFRLLPVDCFLCCWVWLDRRCQRIGADRLTRSAVGRCASCDRFGGRFVWVLLANDQRFLCSVFHGKRT